MKVIYNRLIPLRPFRFINLLGTVFARQEKAYRHDGSWYWYYPAFSQRTEIHELIHSSQMKEMLYIPFYLWYAIEFFVRFSIQLHKAECLTLTQTWNRAYRNISLEQEAYEMQHSPEYPKARQHYSWIKYLTKDN